MSGSQALATEAVVPTLGRSPVFEQCIAALAAQTPRPRIVVVRQGAAARGSLPPAVDQAIDVGENLGFAAATNLGIDDSSSELVATVNDDVVVDPDWLEVLLQALEEAPRAGAVQGLNLLASDPSAGEPAELVDGCGIAWNRWWQAVQRGHGETRDAVPASTFPVAGVSATAALYRRSALEQVRLTTGDVFDRRLESYYEDVDLSLRLARAGWQALCVPEARAHHLGSVTGKTLGRHRTRLIYGNRWLVLARAAGFGLLPLLPALLARDLVDLATSLAKPGNGLGIVGGWLRAVRRFATFFDRHGSLAVLRQARAVGGGGGA